MTRLVLAIVVMACLCAGAIAQAWLTGNAGKGAMGSGVPFVNTCASQDGALDFSVAGCNIMWMGG